MYIEHEPLILILSSPSGGGKSTIAKYILKNDKQIEMSISLTTRTKRENEIDGKDYFFISPDFFMKKVQDNLLLEYATIYGNFYGTSKEQVQKILSQGKDVLFDIDWQGTSQLKSMMPENIVSIFILPPTYQELEKRLRSRGTEDENSLKTRLNQAKDDISHWDCYDYLLVNKDIQETREMVRSILIVERLKRTNTWKVADLLLNHE